MSDKDYEVLRKEPLYDGYFRADRWHVRYRRHDGGWSDDHGLEVFDRGHAVSVLPYDAAADAVVLVEQFRIAACQTTEPPWLMEAVAGATKRGEEPEEVARREALEEAGLSLGRLHHVMRFLPSPGAVTEELHVYIGEADSQMAGGHHGLADEHEDIKVHVVAFAEALAMVEDGRIVVANTVIPVLWLALHKDEIRAAWR
ncbi:MAG: ADP-ribose diphosphatase [Rhodospirillaceae bacterium]|nr:ADP-ribose diphosphatase [Rhodospirillaceae bacterium]